MGSSSVSTHRGLVHWQGILLVVSLLHFQCLHTIAPQNMWFKTAAEGENVHLRIRNKPSDVIRLVWYRGEVLDKDHIIAFLAHTPKYHIRGPPNGRVTVNYDGSLVLKKVNMTDAGIYTVAVEKENSKVLIGYGKLSVYRRVRKPTLRASNTTVTENKDAVVFTCYTNALNIQWLFNGTKFQPRERMKLSKDHRRLTINPVKREDAGKYQCEAFNPISCLASVALELDVKFE